MNIDLSFGPFKATPASVTNTVSILDLILDFDTLSDNSAREQKILEIYEELVEKSKTEEIPETFVDNICLHLDRLWILLLETQPQIAKTIIELRLAWNDQDPHSWYELGKINYHQFITRELDNQDLIIKIFQYVIHLVEQYDDHYDMGFWAYSYMANLHLYQILSGEEALVQAMKNYNLAYRFSQTHTITAHEDFIFDDLDILQNILMNRYPLLVLIYNDAGVSLFEYLFQFVEVITAEQRFIPNFTALMSVVDERMNEIFNSTISSAYLILENRLMVMTSLYDVNKAKWIKIAFIFSYVQQSDEDIEIDQVILSKVKELKASLLADEEIMEHLRFFKGKHNMQISIKIEEMIQEVFARDST